MKYANMKKTIFLLLIVAYILTPSKTHAQQISLDNSDGGWKMVIDGKPQVINGMNWDYFPIGTNYSYSLWNQSPEFIKRALDYEMGVLKNMNVNAIRVYTGIPKEWITYIYDNYGIYTMLNHSFGRYGLTIDGAWMGNTEYSDPRVRELLLSETRQLVEDYKGTRGLLLYLLGNENNYGLFWDGAETEDVPEDDSRVKPRARAMYKLFNEAIVAMKEIDSSYPIAICNGDLLFFDIIVEEVKDMDIFGTNTYRGVSFTDLYERVKNEFGKPVLLTEFGSDAFNAVSFQEDQAAQAYYQKGNWYEIYANAAGMGNNDNSIGGFTFQFSDGWWKQGQTEELDIHNVAPSWENGGYTFDHVEGENNMNEEWFGIVAKGPTNYQGFYEVYPRAAYYVLQKAHMFDPYAPGLTQSNLNDYFSTISIEGANLQARSDKAALRAERADIIKVDRFTLDLKTFSTGGSLISTPDAAVPNSQTFPNQLGFDHMQSIFIGLEANPAPNVRGNIAFNILGNVAQNPINEVFYENRGRPVILEGPNGRIIDNSNERLAIYSSNYTWDHKLFKMEGFYRTGHYHWGYEGDFFGFYPEANYGPNLDIYNGLAPFGFEVEGRRQFDGLKVAFGPELWWGANPAVLVKYSSNLGKTQWTGIFHEDIQRQGAIQTSFAVPRPRTRRVSLYAKREFGKLDVEAGGLWGGSPLIGRDFQLARDINGTTQVFQDEIGSEDNFGGKVKFTYEGGLFNWYAQSAIMGLVADGGADQTQTFTGWRLKDSGSGNQYNFLTGFTYTIGKIQIAPNFLWQQPIEGPIPQGLDAPARLRNILDDPFVVRANREQIAGEILFTFDPTPGTWMYEWDNDRSEDAKFAASIGIVYRHLPTSQDAAIGFQAGGREFLRFPGAAPAEDLWEVNARIVSKLNRDFGVIATLYGGNAQANGSDQRLIHRYGADVRMIYNNVKLNTHVRFNDWGPFDYHRDFNLTFPTQLMADFSTTLGKPDWFDLPTTRFGVRGTWRSLNRFSPRYGPATSIGPNGDPVTDTSVVGFGLGTEWEFQTYIQIDIRN